MDMTSFRNGLVNSLVTVVLAFCSVMVILTVRQVVRLGDDAGLLKPGVMILTCSICMVGIFLMLRDWRKMDSSSKALVAVALLAMTPVFADGTNVLQRGVAILYKNMDAARAEIMSSSVMER